MLSLFSSKSTEFENKSAFIGSIFEKTLIVFFGDHQPAESVVRPILRFNGINTSDMSVEEAKLRYQVPYVIWANYDIEEETGADTDISFLAAEVLKRADMPTTAFQKFLLELEKTPDSEKLLNQYEILKYYYMFDYQKE